MAELIITSVLLGAGLAMDAFSVSLANGLADSNMNKKRMLAIAGTFALFQFAMPMIGWAIVKHAAEKLEWFSPLIPWIALALLLWIGGGLLKEGIAEQRELKESAGEADSNGVESASNSGEAASKGGEIASSVTLGTGELMMQGVATSIDALSVGFTISAYGFFEALGSSIIIGVVTLVICLAGLRIGRRLGTRLAGKASILGGVILIAIGLEIWIKGVFF